MLQQTLKIIRVNYKEFKIKRQRKALVKEYNQHAFPQTLDWNWKQTNFNRIAAVNFLASQFENPRYLEIGCDKNKLFDSVPITDKVGVDPEQGGTLQITSDEFFQSNPDKFDIVFIDGLHTYDQVRRDVVNSINYLQEGGAIALHDMLPRGWKEQHVPSLTKAWNGDVWKVAFELSNTAGIDFKIVKIDHGVGVFRITDQFDELIDRRAELTDKQFDYFYNNLDKLPLIDWNEFIAWARTNTKAS